MKKIAFVLFAMLIISTSTNADAAQHDVTIKAGVIVPIIMKEQSPKKVSLDWTFGFNIGIVKFFAVGFETGLNWVSWKSQTGDQRENGTNVQKKEVDAFTMPFFVNFMIRFDKRTEWGVMPYILPGIGYGFTFFLHPDSQETYHGFTWQILTGISITMGDINKIEIIVEFGYRGAQYKHKNDYELDMSGMVFHAGVRLPLGIENQ